MSALPHGVELDGEGLSAGVTEPLLPCSGVAEL